MKPLLLQLLAAATVAASGAGPSPNVGDVAPDFTLPYATRDSVAADSLKLSSLVGKRNVVASEPSMGGEDMSLALEAVPGVFAFVGGNDGTARASFPHHHPKFDVNEACLEVGAGFIDSLSRPGGNATGFLLYEYSMAAKWLEFLKQIAPNVTRAAVLRDATTPSGTGQFAAIQAVAPSLKIDAMPVNLRDARELERSIASFARTPNGGLVVTGSSLTILHRELIIALAALRTRRRGWSY